MDTPPLKAPNAPAAPPPEYAFELVDVTREFKLEGHRIHVLEGITLSVRFGEWISLVGPSGCGKTTLLHIMGALDRPTSGRVSCHGTAVEHLSGRRVAALRRAGVGMVFQSYHLLPELTALENAVLPALRHGLNKGVFRRRAVELLESFGLGHRLGHRPKELSGGEQQRVAVARALINDPPILLADEPTGNLDDDSSNQIVNIFERLRRDHQKTIVMVTHDTKLAHHADRVIHLVDGVARPENDHQTPGGPRSPSTDVAAS